MCPVAHSPLSPCAGLCLLTTRESDPRRRQLIQYTRRRLITDSCLIHQNDRVTLAGRLTRSGLTKAKFDDGIRAELDRSLYQLLDLRGSSVGGQHSAALERTAAVVASCLAFMSPAFIASVGGGRTTRT